VPAQVRWSCRAGVYCQRTDSRRRPFGERADLGGNGIVHVHQTRGGGDGLRVLLTRRVNHQQRPRVPFTAVGDTLVFGAPAWQWPPHLRAPGVIALHNKRGVCPAWLRTENVEHLPEEPIGVVERIEIRTAESELACLAIPESDRMRSRNMQVNDVGVAGGKRVQGVLLNILYRCDVTDGVPIGLGNHLKAAMSYHLKSGHRETA